MKKFLLIFAISMLAAISSHAQGVRFSSIVLQQATVAGATNVVTIPPPPAIVSFCNAPANAAPCTNKATTYTDATLGTPCSTATQIVLDGTSSCVASPNSQGNWGVWLASGQYTYTIQVGGATQGPFFVTAGGSTGAITVASYNALFSRALDCTQPSFAGADFGITINNCIAAASAGSAITLANFPNFPASLTTAVNINKAIVVYCGGIRFNQFASITLSSSGAEWIGYPFQPGDVNTPCTAIKNANFDQFIISAPNTSVQYVAIAGNRGSGLTGNGITISGGTPPSNVLVAHNTITQEAGISIADTSNADVKIEDNLLTDYGGTGITVSGSGGTHRIYNNTVNSNASATGPVLNDTNAGLVIFSGNNFPNLAATDNVVVNTAGQFQATNNNILNNGGSSRIGINGSSGNPQITLQGNSVSGGSGFPALSAQSATYLYASGNSFGSGGQTDAVLIGNTSATVFSGNKVNISSTSLSGVSGIHLKGDTIGNLITNNQIKVSSTTPTGNDYCIWLDTSVGGHFLNHIISGNICTGTTQASFDVGIFFDNTSNLAVSGSNVINNMCIDVTQSKCIVRIDAGNVSAGYYSNNKINTGVTYGLAGSTQDAIVDYSTTFANLPNAGINSKIFCSDCTATTPTAASGPGANLTRINSVWSGSPIISTGFFNQTTTTVGALPAAAAGNKGQMISVSDSTAVAAEGQTCVGGGAVTALAFSNGTVWKCF